MSIRKNIMLMSSNGAGLGHLTRLMAMGHHLRKRHNVMIFTLSRAAAIPTSLGYPVEYFTSRLESESTGEWNRRLRHRVDALLLDYQIDGVFFDGTYPYRGLVRALDQHPNVARGWIRRGMWKPDVGAASIANEEHFDITIEPGDYAAEFDTGLTTIHRADHSTSPVVLNDSQPYSRSEARMHLGMAQDGDAALLLLGAGQINDTDSLTSNMIRELSKSPELQIILGESVLSRQQLDLPDRVSVASVYPISRYFNAFDFAAMACGYNSFHEALSFQLPTLFVPNTETKTDNQVARAQWADDHGLAVSLGENDLDHLPNRLAKLVDFDARNNFVAAMRKLPPAHGGAEAATVITNLLNRPRTAAKANL